jgi:hypothetical protein
LITVTSWHVGFRRRLTGAYGLSEARPLFEHEKARHSLEYARLRIFE